MSVRYVKHFDLNILKLADNLILHSNLFQREVWLLSPTLKTALLLLLIQKHIKKLKMLMLPLG
jgi:hypothetical protein